IHVKQRAIAVRLCLEFELLTGGPAPREQQDSSQGRRKFSPHPLTSHGELPNISLPLLNLSWKAGPTRMWWVAQGCHRRQIFAAFRGGHRASTRQKSYFFATFSRTQASNCCLQPSLCSSVRTSSSAGRVGSTRKVI